MLVQHVDELRERRGDVHVLLVLDALEALLEDLLVDHGRFLRVFIIRLEIHEERHERRLAVRRHERIDLVLDGLDAVFHFLAGALPGDLFGLFHIRLDAVDLFLLFDDRGEIFLIGLPHEGREDAVMRSTPLMLWPPYWPLATCAMICVVTVHATWKDLGVSIFLPLITVPFWSMSSRLMRQQLNMGWMI